MICMTERSCQVPVSGRPGISLGHLGEVRPIHKTPVVVRRVRFVALWTVCTTGRPPVVWLASVYDRRLVTRPPFMPGPGGT